MPYHRRDASFEERVAASIAAMRVEIVVLAAAVLLAMGVGTYGFVNGNDATSQAQRVARAQSALAHRALTRADEAAAIAVAQRESRRQAFLYACKQENKANRRIDRFLIEITPIRKRRTTPHFQSRVQALADAFDPKHRNCFSYALNHTK